MYLISITTKTILLKNQFQFDFDYKFVQPSNSNKFKINMQQQSMLELAQESDQAFRNQFDPHSQTFHGGPKVPVPLNGQRVPQSMSTIYPQGYDPSAQPQTIDYGEGYRKVESDRNVFLNLKKSLAKLCPVVQSFLRHDQIFKEKGDPNNQNHVHVHEQNIKKEKANLQAVNIQLEAYIPQLQQIGQQGNLMVKQLKEIIEQSKKKYDSKESLANFNFKVKKVSTQTFSNAQKCLQKLKDIKKQYTNSKKQQKKQQKTQAQSQ